MFQKRTEQIFGDIPNVQVVFDDIIVGGKDDEEHDTALRAVFERARKNCVRFNLSKLQYRKSHVKYMGVKISACGIQPDENKVKAILEMPTPQCKKDLQRFLGMVTYLSRFVPNFSNHTENLRQLLRKDAVWQWSFEHDAALEKLKRAISSSPVLRVYDAAKPSIIQTDASSYGLGACLLQDNFPVAFMSRTLSEAERNYAQIEKELLAVVFACDKFHQFVYGQSFIVHSDHKPLQAIVKKSISSTSPRLQRMLLKLLKYDFSIQYIPGKNLLIADTLSRACQAGEVDKELHDDMEVMVHSLVENFPATTTKKQELREATQQDTILAALKRIIVTGWPNSKDQLPDCLKVYWSIRDDIVELEGLLFYGHKLIVPVSSRPLMLSTVHESHLGIERCKAIARQHIFWPGMSRDVETWVSRCSICSSLQREKIKQPLLQHDVPHRPWEKLALDIFELHGKDYLLVVDYFSKYPEIAQLASKSAESVVLQLKSLYARHGIPDCVVCDNVPFSSKYFMEFAREWNFNVITSSPHYPQSNGMAERTIQTVKTLLKKAHMENRDPYVALLYYRNSPVSGMTLSPAQMLMSRALKTKLPVMACQLMPEINHPREELLARQTKQKLYYDRYTKMQPSFSYARIYIQVCYIREYS
jgi:hypothetical protein